MECGSVPHADDSGAVPTAFRTRCERRSRERSENRAPFASRTSRLRRRHPRPARVGGRARLDASFLRGVKPSVRGASERPTGVNESAGEGVASPDDCESKSGVSSISPIAEPSLALRKRPPRRYLRFVERTPPFEKWSVGPRTESPSSTSGVRVRSRANCGRSRPSIRVAYRSTWRTASAIAFARTVCS